MAFFRLHRKNNSTIITKTNVPMTEPVIGPSGDFEEDLAELALALAVTEGTDGVCDGVCDELGGAKRGVTSDVSNENLSSSNSLLPFALEPRFVTTAVW